MLEQLGCLKGALSAHQQLSLISGCWDIQEAVEGAMHIQVSRGPRRRRLGLELGPGGGGGRTPPHGEETKAVKRNGRQKCAM